MAGRFHNGGSSSLCATSYRNRGRVGERASGCRGEIDCCLSVHGLSGLSSLRGSNFLRVGLGVLLAGSAASLLHVFSGIRTLALGSPKSHSGVQIKTYIQIRTTIYYWEMCPEILHRYHTPVLKGPLNVVLFLSMTTFQLDGIYAAIEGGTRRSL